MSSEAPAVERARIRRDDAQRQVARAEDARVEERPRAPAECRASERRHSPQAGCERVGFGRESHDAAGEPERKVAAFPVNRPREDGHLCPEAVAALRWDALALTRRDTPGGDLRRGA